MDTKFEYILQTITPEYIDKLSSGTIILELERKSQVVGEKPTGRTDISLGLKASVNIANTEIDHYLLYAIPIQMKIRTLVGIRPDMVRVFSTAAFIFLLIVRLANFQIER